MDKYLVLYERTSTRIRTFALHAEDPSSVQSHFNGATWFPKYSQALAMRTSGCGPKLFNNNINHRFSEALLFELKSQVYHFLDVWPEAIDLTSPCLNSLSSPTVMIIQCTIYRSVVRIKWAHRMMPDTYKCLLFMSIIIINFITYQGIIQWTE